MTDLGMDAVFLDVMRHIQLFDRNKWLDYKVAFVRRCNPTGVNENMAENMYHSLVVFVVTTSMYCHSCYIQLDQT
jgi:hypothetical protein